MIKRIGIFGGTFNPVHNAHLTIAEQSYLQYQLDQVIFMPAGKPPHKQNEHILEDKQRLDMLALAIINRDYIVISDYEIQKKGLSYTAETLIELTALNPQYRYYFIMGTDSLFQLENWRSPEIICRLTTLLVAIRDPEHKVGIYAQADYLKDKFGARVELIVIPNHEISSHDIRARVSLGQTIHDMVPAAVESYIHSNHLYTKSQ